MATFLRPLVLRPNLVPNRSAGFVVGTTASVPLSARSRPPALKLRRGYASATEVPPSPVTRARNLLLGAAIGGSILLGYFYITDTRAGVHRWLVVPVLRWCYPDAEDAHEAGNSALRWLYQFGMHPRERGDPDKAGDLQIDVFGHTLANPIGTSAGIDKHAEIPTPLLALGPAIIEIGGATPYPQDGNHRPRVFRLPSQKALVNRYGLNSEGADSVAMRLRHRVREFAYAMGYGIDEVAERKVLDGEAGVPPGSLVSGRLLAVQIAKNKFTPDDDIEAIKQDYVYCVDVLSKYADIIVVNVSSPNTPGLRDLQRVEPLTNILAGIVSAAAKTDRRTKPAVMVKVSPDEDSEEQVAGICEAVARSGVDGVIVGNTTKRRPDPLPAGTALPSGEARIMLEEQGGYSGPQLFERTIALVKRYRRLLDQGPEDNGHGVQAADGTGTSSPRNVPAQKIIFATGGITNGAQALEALNAGASVAMVYTALVYGGAGTISRIKEEMRAEMEKQMRRRRDDHPAHDRADGA